MPLLAASYFPASGSPLTERGGSSTLLISSSSASLLSSIDPESRQGELQDEARPSEGVVWTRSPPVVSSDSPVGFFCPAR